PFSRAGLDIKPMNRVLVVGAPRSGTTWLAQVLAAEPGSRLVHEPDNPAFHPDAAEARALYGGYASLHRGERVPAYEELWDAAFATAPADGPVIAKSVYAAFALEWLAHRYAPQVVIIERHPVRVVASWMRLGFHVGQMPTRERITAEHVERALLPAWDPQAPRLVQVSWVVALLMTAMCTARLSHPEWTVVSHEWLSAYPAGRLAALAGALDLRWTETSESLVRNLGVAPTVPVAVDAGGIPIAWNDHPVADARAAMALLRRFPALSPWVGAAASDADAMSSEMPNSMVPSR
ncbi:MAG: sulfotransferase, partial [Candidatus Dormibacteria bacterium]